MTNIDVKTGRDAYIELLESFRIFFKNQARILYKEVKTIKYATNYYRRYEKYYNKDKLEVISQEALELESIYDGIRVLEKKSYDLVDIFRTKKEKEKKLTSQQLLEEKEVQKQIAQKDVEIKIDGEYIKLLKKIEKRFDNTHITILPIIDSIIIQFSDLFDELNFYKQTYFNLVDSKEFSYIPSPKFNKRFRNANLGLFINKQINDKSEKSYSALIMDFYKLNRFSTEKDIENFKNINFLSTWSYTTHHLIKKFTSNRNLFKNENSKENSNHINKYISMSYTYLDKSLFQPITLHEISHSMNHKKLTDKQRELLNDSLYIFKNKNLFKKDNPLCDLYEEILCDFSAFYAIGHSYIISLVHIGFFELKNLFFDENSATCIKNNHDFNIPSNNDLAPKNFDFNVNNIYLSVRLLLLVDLCKKLKIDNSYINGIEYMLSIIFPKDKYVEFELDKNNFTNHIENGEPSFLSIYEFLSENSFYYKQSRNLVFSLYEKFKSILFNKTLFDNFKKRKQSNGKDLKWFVNKIKSDNVNKDLHSIFKKHNYNSIFDILWLVREYKPKYNNSNLHITERDINRLFNIYKIYILNIDKKKDKSKDLINKWKEFNEKVIENFFDSSKQVFYNLELIKYKATNHFHPYNEFTNMNKDDPYYNKIGYIFAPYDIVRLNPVKYISALSSIYEDYPFRYNKTIDEKNKYFIDRHSLFLLEEIDENKKSNKNRDFDLILEIKLDNIFSVQDNIDILTFLRDYFNKEKEKFNNCKIFKSLGGEDYLVYISGLEFCLIGEYGKKMISKIYTKYKKTFVEIEDLIILNNPHIDYSKNNNTINASFSSFAKINKQHNEANNYFAEYLTNNLKKLLPEKKYISRHYSSTNRFDCIISWEEQEDENIFTVFKNYLEKIYYKDKDEEPFFADFNIEILYKQYHDEWKKEENK